MAESQFLIEGFEILEPIGHGGMGTVYRARQEFFDRDVALKVVQPHLASDSQFRARFRSEMRHAALIDHSNVVPVYAAGESNGNLFIAMKLIDGQNLSQQISSQGQLSPDSAFQVVKQIASALDAAHDQGFIHRDVKPANILIEKGSGRAFLSDFGIAKSLEATQSHTATGHGIGAVRYVSPEQIKNEDLDRRVDVYSLGCVFFEALTGSLPFEDGSDASILFAKMNDDARVPSEIDPQLHRFDLVVQKALAVERTDRFSTAGELSAAVRAALVGTDETRILTGDGEATTPFPNGRSKVSESNKPAWLRVAAFGGLAVCALLVLGLFISHQGDDGEAGNESQLPTSPSKPEKSPKQGAIAEPSDANDAEIEESTPEATTPVDLSTTTVSRRQFQVEIPKGWLPDQVDDPNSGRFTNTWKSPDNEDISLLIDSQYTSEINPSAITSAAQVREQTSRTEGYTESTFTETELNGYPAAKWVFSLPEDKRVDYFVYQCGIGLAILGAAPHDEFSAYRNVFANVAKSIYVQCE